MCSTLEQIENFLRSPPTDCLNLSTNNGLDLSCSSSYYNEECLNLSSKGSYAAKPQDLSLQQQHHHHHHNQQQPNEIVNLSLNAADSRSNNPNQHNYYYQQQTGRQNETYYNNPGYDRNSPLNLERRSSPLNLTFPTATTTPSSKQQQQNNSNNKHVYYDYNSPQNTIYYNPLEYSSSAPNDYAGNNNYVSSAPAPASYPNNMYCNNNNNYVGNYNNGYNNAPPQQSELFYSCSSCGATFRDQNSQENHVKSLHHGGGGASKVLWNSSNGSGSNSSNNAEVYDPYALDHLNGPNLNMPQNYATNSRQVDMTASYGGGATTAYTMPLVGPVIAEEPLAPPIAPPEPIAPKNDNKKQESITTTTIGGDKKDHHPLLYQCATCLEEFSSTTALSSHQQEHRSMKPHKCSKCPQLFRNLSGLKRHLNRVHGNEKQSLKCEACGKGFYERHDLLRHAKVHTLPKCKDCGKSLKGGSHDCKKKKASAGAGAYPCSICSDSLDSKISWGYHMWKHTKDSSYIITSEDTVLAPESARDLSSKQKATT